MVFLPIPGSKADLPQPPAAPDPRQELPCAGPGRGAHGAEPGAQLRSGERWKGHRETLVVALPKAPLSAPRVPHAGSHPLARRVPHAGYPRSEEGLALRIAPQ